MIMRSQKLIYASVLALFSLLVIAGCAQTRANIKEDISSGSAGPAVLQSIKVSDDASRVEISADKPLSYTYYKTTEPPKMIVDLAHTDPGAVTKVLEVNTGNVQRIDVAKHDFPGGFLSRIEILLAKDVEFSASTDAIDKGKLLITFPHAPIAEKQTKPATKEEEKAAATEPAAKAEVQSAHKEMGAAQEAVKPQAIPASAAAPEATSTKADSTDAKKDASPVSPTGVEPEKVQKLSEITATPKAEADQKSTPAKRANVLTGVAAQSDGIELKADGVISTFKAFKLTRPDRLVLDLAGVKSAIGAKTIAIDRFGIGQARLGIYPEKVRIVFDSAKGILPPYLVQKEIYGLKIVLGEAAVAAAAKEPVKEAAREPAKEAAKEPAKEAAKEPAKEPVKVTANEPVKSSVAGKKADASRPATVEAIDFKVAEGYSQISIKVSGDCGVGKPVKVAEGLALTIKNCQIPPSLQRMIDTSAYPSIVRRITPYQVRVKNRNEARIQVKLRGAAPFTFKQENGTVLWSIKNPEGMKAAVLPSPPPRILSVEGTAESISSPAPTPARKSVAETETEVAPGKPQAAEAVVGDKKIYTGRRVSLEFSDADIRKILQLIAEVSNLNFLIGDDVTGTISIKLVNVPWDQALDVILETKGLEKRQEGNIMYIKPKGKFISQEQLDAEAKKEREKRMELKTRVFDINFATITDVATQFEKLKSDRGSIAPDSRTNRVIVTDIEDRIRKMADLLKELDIPEKQVMIEARIVEASTSFTRDLGVAWGLHYQDGSASILGMKQFDAGFGGIVTNAPTTGTITTAGAAAGMSFGKLTSNVSLDLRLSAAATIGQVKIISTPKVVTLNNKAAKISQGQSIPYQTTSAEGTKTEFVEAALTLEVTPHITADGNISMKIKASNNSPGTGSPPPINKKEATTELQVMNGETTVIGGIYVDSDTESNSGVPFLQDVPLLGWLFKSNSKQKTKTELLIFITPKVVS